MNKSRAEKLIRQVFDVHAVSLFDYNYYANDSESIVLPPLVKIVGQKYWRKKGSILHCWHRIPLLTALILVCGKNYKHCSSIFRKEAG